MTKLHTHEDATLPLHASDEMDAEDRAKVFHFCGNAMPQHETGEVLGKRNGNKAWQEHKKRDSHSRKKGVTRRMAGFAREAPRTGAGWPENGSPPPWPGS